MRARWSYAAVLLLTCRSARPDTITMKDGVSVNCSVLEMSSGILELKAKFPSEEKDVRIPIKDVQSIEFNSLTTNLGAPPKILGFGPPSGQNSPQDVLPAEDVVVLRGGARQPCILVGIDANRVRCGPNDAYYNRNKVLRIVMGTE